MYSNLTSPAKINKAIELATVLQGLVAGGSVLDEEFFDHDLARETGKTIRLVLKDLNDVVNGTSK